jgi:phage terminase large subunit
LKWKIRKARKGPGSIIAGIDKIKGYANLNIVYSKEWNLEQYSYIWDKSKKTDKLENEPVDDYNHLWDALRYGIQGLKERRAKTTVR